jgi:hypothetical protein
MPHEMSGSVDEIFGVLLQEISEIGDRECRLRVVQGLADVVCCVPQAITPEMRGGLFELIGAVLGDLQIDVRTMDGMNAASEAFNAIFRGLEAVVSLRDEFIGENFGRFIAPVYAFIETRAFCPKTLIPMFGYLKELARAVGPRAAIPLHRKKIREVIEGALPKRGEERTQLGEKAEELREFLLHFKG